MLFVTEPNRLKMLAGRILALATLIAPADRTGVPGMMGGALPGDSDATAIGSCLLELAITCTVSARRVVTT